jgi:hypothetical protein
MRLATRADSSRRGGTGLSPRVSLPAEIQGRLAAAYESNLAGSLNLAKRLSEAGRYEEALNVSRQATEICGRLAAPIPPSRLGVVCRPVP